jgi:transcriptional regulator with XRE-family HTH domain
MIVLLILSAVRMVFMTSNDLKAWQSDMHYTQAQAAEALGVSLATYKDWICGVSRTHRKPVTIDKRTALACAAIVAGLSEYAAR